MKTLELVIQINVPDIHLNSDGTIPMKIKQKISEEINARMDVGVIINDNVKLDSGYRVLNIKEKGE